MFYLSKNWYQLSIIHSKNIYDYKFSILYLAYRYLLYLKYVPKKYSNTFAWVLYKTGRS